MRFINDAILMLATFFVASICYAQENNNQRKHFLSLNTGLYNALDGNPIYQSKTYYPNDIQKYPVAFSLNFGLEYSRQYSHSSTFGFSLSSKTYQRIESVDELFRGKTLERNFLEVRGIHRQNILNTKRHSLSISNDICFRFGNELFLLAYGVIGSIGPDQPVIETLPWSRPIADLGTAVGFRYQFALTRFLTLHSEINYTFYPLTYYNKHYLYSFDKGTTRNLLVLNTGITFGLGENQLEKQTKLNKIEKQRKNLVFIQRSLYNFFRNEPTIQKRYNDLGFGPNLSQSFGFGFQRKLGEKNYISFIIEDYEFRNSIPSKDIVNGETKARSFLGSTISYLHSLKNFNSGNFLGHIGLYYRHGSEYFAGDKNSNEEVNRFSEKLLRDIGLSAGLKIYKKFYRNVNIQTSLNYTHFVYVHDQVGTTYSWDRNPTNNMISLSLGLGLNYGK